MVKQNNSYLPDLSKQNFEENKMNNSRFRIGITILIALVLLGTALAGCGGKENIKIGAPMPITGPYASDGQQMQMALELAIEEQNTAGGVLGRQLTLVPGDVGALEAEKIKAVGERLLAEGVDAVITGYADSGVDARVFGEYDMPYLHADAMSQDTDVVASDLDKYGNVFQYCPSEVSYGHDTANTLFTIPAQMGWTAPNNKIAIIKVDYSYNILAADLFAELAQEQGYEVVLDETISFGTIEWGPILSKIEENQPAYVTFWVLDAASAAQFMLQWTDRFGDSGFDALIYMQYTPNIPEFLTLAGESANGVLWTSSVNPVGSDIDTYAQRWQAKFNEEPKSVYAYIVRDAFDIRVQAVEKAGCVDCYDKVIENIRAAEFNGHGGKYMFNPPDQQALSGVEYLPTLWYQIQNVANVVVGPSPYATTSFTLPPWIK
jgi:branched-chain amino acid transport system substrate-binding protein